MCMKLTSVISAALVLILASTTVGIVIGDFENNSTDGWEAADSTILTGFSLNGATLNQSSIWIETPTGNVDSLVLDLIENDLVDEFRNNLKISMDITRLTFEWGEMGSWWCAFYVGVNAGYDDESGSWSYSDQMDESADWGPAYGDDPINFTYDYSLVHNNIDYDNLSYLELVLATNWGGFDPGGVYYIDNIQIFGEGTAYNPEPSDGERDLPVDTTLSWTPGVHADKHDLYFGTNPDAVNNADRTNIPEGVVFVQDYELNTYNPGELVPGTTYIWRVDEVNDTNIWKGDLWNFTTVYPGQGVVIGDWEDNMDNWVKYPDTARSITFGYSTTGATLNNKSLKVDLAQDIGWAWILRLVLNESQTEAFVNNDLLSMDVTWVESEWQGHSWSQVQQIAINAEAFNWDWRELTPPTFDTANPEDPGAWDPINFPGTHTRTLTWDYSSIPVDEIPLDSTVQLNFSQGHDGSIGPVTYYFDNVKFTSSKPASNPSPAYQATDVKTEPTLSWSAGKHAVSHNVYIGTNYTDIKDVKLANLADYPDVTFVNVSDNTYNPGLLSFGTTYYWRVDEVNEAHPEMLWEGEVWAFTTGDYIALDDFEAYNDINEGEEGCKRIYLTWMDGYVNPNVNGSTIGYPAPDFANGEHIVETNIVHGGNQSAPLLYNNTTANYSEVTLNTNEMALGSDWTQYGLNTLTIWFYGDPNNPATDQLYVKLNNSKIVYDGDVADISAGRWIQWNIELSTFGINLSNVTQIGIGLDKIGATGGEGILFIDDIRLRYVEQ